MKQVIRSLVLLSFLLGVKTACAQRKIESSRIVLVEEAGDSLFCREQEVLFEVLDFEFDSCALSKNRFFVTFRLLNKTRKVLFVDPDYISWYDTNSLRAKGKQMQAVNPGEAIVITLESIPYGKRRMNSPGKLLVLYGQKELFIPIRLKQEYPKVIHCSEGGW
ncbi:hypothetical protein [Fluviicola chungangensis]|uniref:DUF4352 domain-containing protein n=1 Tax=Fluviicola chungangensis TaxID=2597671 RepID=A0A556N6D3_9FLAO|nr:hypothetical protein [Fluviicola chungangensis]TSJ47623.1 hypothetical protein FO442_00420 [Fluviicola chungangensis]